ncbi:hypothetical protein [Maricaulis sp.]|uniref:hypothetical protein n=1 Tax=Maricaulis sp. TaxID=1486257 RepID=UPI0025C69D25|nr:hypothetical protein [Maricaulis sp.]
MAALTLAATLIAPRLGRRAKLSANIRGMYPIRSKDFGEGIRLKIFHGDNEVENDLYVISFEIFNSGSKDIVWENFIDPATIKLPDDSKIVSHTYEAPKGVGENIEVVGNLLSIKWKILKPGEYLGISVVCQHNLSAINNNVEMSEVITSNLDYNIRLKDVDLVFKSKLGPRKAFAIVVAPALFVLFSIIMYISYLDTNTDFVYNNGGIYSGVVISDGDVELCDVSNLLPILRTCEESVDDISSITEYIVPNEFELRVGLRRAHVLVMVSGFFLYLTIILAAFYRKGNAQHMFTFYRLVGARGSEPFYFGADKK